MRLVIIGGVAAGLSAAGRARRLDRNLDILVLERGPVISYSACGLPYYLEGRVLSPQELIHYTPEAFARERNISVRTGSRVVAISHPRREVALDAGERVRYDRLVIATGARPDLASISGTELSHVFTLHTLDDAVRLKRFLQDRKPRRGVVAGAGYIGLEAADVLRRYGVQVSVVEQNAQVLGRDDPELTDFMRRLLERFGVELRLGERIRAAGDLAADVVVLAPGLRPNVELAADAGVEIGRTGAIRTDERAMTSLNGVYAAGDCAETTHLITGRPVYIPLGTTANKMGRVAGANAAGSPERFPGVVGTSIVKAFGIGIASTGLSEFQARREGFSPVSARIQAFSRPRYFWGQPTTVHLVADRQSRRLLGGTVTGQEGADARINVIATALHSRMRVDDFEQLDLAYAPPYAPVWDPLLICAQQLMKTL